MRGGEEPKDRSVGLCRLFGARMWPGSRREPDPARDAADNDCRGHAAHAGGDPVAAIDAEDSSAAGPADNYGAPRCGARPIRTGGAG